MGNYHISPEESEILDRVLPSADVLALAISYELGVAIGQGLFVNYPESFNKGISELSKKLRSWLVRPPGQSYLIGEEIKDGS